MAQVNKYDKDNINDGQFPRSDRILVFPTANRDPKYDPQSRSMTEENVTNINKAITSYHSYVISEGLPERNKDGTLTYTGPFEFVIDGYYVAVYDLWDHWKSYGERTTPEGLWAVIHKYSVPDPDPSNPTYHDKYLDNYNTRVENRRLVQERELGHFNRGRFIQLAGRDNEWVEQNPQTKSETPLYSGITFVTVEPTKSDCCVNLKLLDENGKVPPESRYIFTSDVIDMDILDCGVVDSTTSEVYVPTPKDEGVNEERKCVSEGTCTDK